MLPITNPSAYDTSFANTIHGIMSSIYDASPVLLVFIIAVGILLLFHELILSFVYVSILTQALAKVNTFTQLYLSRSFHRLI